LGAFEVVEIIKNLLCGKNDLILAMNALLPDELQILAEDLHTLEEMTSSNNAVGFMITVREAFSSDEVKYQEFLRIVNAFKSQESDEMIREIVQQVKVLFAGHPALLIRFNSFLPEGHRIPPHERQSPAHALYI
jgi:histone deacetylase complex regulatory component SIN3